MVITALGCIDLWLSLYCHPSSSSYFPTVSTKSKPHDGKVRAFFCSDSLVDTRPLPHCLCVKQAHHSASIFIYRLIRTLFSACIAMASYRTRNESDELLKEHSVARERAEVSFLTGRDGSSDRASIYSFSDSSSSSTIDLDTESVVVSQPYPGSSLLAPGRIAPANFATVVGSQIYRCGYPSLEHYDFLRSLELKTIITLVDKETPIPYTQFMRDAGIRHVICPITPNKGDQKRTTVKQIAAALTVMMDPKNQPVLIHCNKGKHRSGCVTASFRKCIGMGMDAILEEYAQHAGEKARDLDVAFIRAFDEKHFLCSVRRETLTASGSAQELEHVIDPLTPLGRVPRPRV